MSVTAILLVCAMPVAPDACTQATAVDIISQSKASELACATGWQEMIARGSLREGIGEKFWIKTLCIRHNEPLRRAEAG